MSRYLLFLFVTTFLGCASKHNFAGKHFESSNSLCLDALIVNMEADGCKNMSAEQSEDEKLLKISCTDSKIDGNSAWLTHTFLFCKYSACRCYKNAGNAHVCRSKLINDLLTD